jgi:hypothetical protein
MGRGALRLFGGVGPGRRDLLSAALELEPAQREQDGTHSELGAGMRIAGVTSLVAGDDRRIASVAIHHRPLAAVIAFSDEMRRRLEGQVDPSHFHAASAGAET